MSDHGQLSPQHVASGCWGHSLLFKIVLLGDEFLKAAYWRICFMRSNLAHRKPHPHPANPWKCWLPLTLCPVSRQATPGSSGLRNVFFQCESFTKLGDYPLKLQGAPIVLCENPPETPLTQCGRSRRSPPVLCGVWGGTQYC